MARQLKITDITIIGEEENKLVKRLSSQFAKEVKLFENGDWELAPIKKSNANYGQLKTYYLKFPNSKNRNYKRQGLHSFIKSVAIRSGVFLIAESDLKGDKKRKPKPYYGSPEKTRDHYEKNTPPECSEVLIITNFNPMIRKLAETLTKGTTIKIINNSRKKKLISRIRQASKEQSISKDWGDATPKTQITSNNTGTKEKKRYSYYQTLARPNQANFRNDLLEEYGAACMITGCTTKAALEAAHIEPFADGGKDTLENGLLLRADLHLLFDKKFMGIDPNTDDPDIGIVHFSKDAGDHYKKYEQKEIKLPIVSRETLAARWQEFNKESE